jgi:hypothetical protein
VNEACQENLECHFGYACHGFSRPALEYLKLSTLRTRRYHLHTLLLVQVYLGYKFCPSVLETVFVSLLGISETFLRSMFALQLKTVLPDAHQLLMLSAGILISLELKMFPLIIFCYEHCASQFVTHQLY